MKDAVTDQRVLLRRRWSGDPLAPLKSLAARLDDAFRDAARSGDYRKPELFTVMCEYVAAATRISNNTPSSMALRLGAYARLSAAMEGTSAARAEVETEALLECCPPAPQIAEPRFLRESTAWRREGDVPDPDRR